VALSEISITKFKKKVNGYLTKMVEVMGIKPTADILPAYLALLACTPIKIFNQ